MSVISAAIILRECEMLASIDSLTLRGWAAESCVPWLRGGLMLFTGCVSFVEARSWLSLRDSAPSSADLVMAG